MIACLAHNLSRWVGQLGLEDETWRTARTIRRRLIALPGRLTRTARRSTLHLPARWPWRDAFVEALEQDQGAAGRGLTLPSPASPIGRPPGRLGLLASRSPATGGWPYRASPPPDTLSSTTRFSPFTRSSAAIRLSVRVNRWIEGLVEPLWEQTGHADRVLAPEPLEGGSRTAPDGMHGIRCDELPRGRPLSFVRVADGDITRMGSLWYKESSINHNSQLYGMLSTGVPMHREERKEARG